MVLDFVSCNDGRRRRWELQVMELDRSYPPCRYYSPFVISVRIHSMELTPINPALAALMEIGAKDIYASAVHAVTFVDIVRNHAVPNVPNDNLNVVEW